MGETQHHTAPGSTASVLAMHTEPTEPTEFTEAEGTPGTSRPTGSATRRPATDLVRIARAFRRGTASLVELRTALDHAVLYALRPSTPGLLVFDLPTGSGRWIVACTSLPAFRRFLDTRDQRAADWLRTTGADLIAHVPSGVGVVIDPGADHGVALPAVWLT